MAIARRLAAGALILVMTASLVYTAGSAWYVRSDAYRQECAQSLSANLALPCDIGAVVPRSWSSREYRDVVVWLPERRDHALTCERSVVYRTPAPDDPDGYEIEIFGGAAEISTRTWLRSDYRGVVESGLRAGLAPGGPRQIRFGDMSLIFERDGFRLRLSNAAGRVQLQPGTRGTATISANAINDYAVAEPVLLTAAFSMKSAGARIDELALTAPEIPIEALRMGRLVGADVTAGSFSGRLLYGENERGRDVVVSGRLRDVKLEECTAGRTAVPWRGRCAEIQLQELRLHDGRLDGVRFQGALTDVRLSDVLATWGLSVGDGSATLEVGRAELAPDGVQSFVASGRCAGVSLKALTDSLGLGGMSGALKITIDDLTIEANQLKSMDATVVVEDGEDSPNWVEGRLLRSLVESALRVKLPNILPERLEYTRFGLRLEVRDEILRVYGTHGPREKTILTVRIAGQDWPLIQEPEREFDLRELADWLRARAAERLRRHLPHVPGATP